MRLRDLGASTRFFMSLGVLLGALATMAVLSLSGLAAVDGANRQVFQDNFLTAEATNRVAADVARVEVLSLEVAGTADGQTAEQLRARLDEVAIPRATASIGALLRTHTGDGRSEYAQVQGIAAEWRAFLSVVRQARLDSGSGISSASERSSAARTVEGRLDPLIASLSARQAIEVEAAGDAHEGATHTYDVSQIWLLIATAIALLAAGSMVRTGLTLRRLLAAQAEAQDHGESASEYTETLLSTENEGEAQELLRRQVERTHPGTRAVVLGRNNSADRLEARTSLLELGELREPLEHATPRSCLAIRFARSHAEGGPRPPLTMCELCGGLPSPSTCDPLLVSGEVIGSVLVTHPGLPDKRISQRIRETVSQAAPVLGNLRNLAIAEMRAATDRLTGLPNQRAVQDTLKRMVAQASRTISPLTAVLLDLDHFKQVNDLYGHDRGDELLATVGVALRTAVRSSDFVGRYGGEEFLILLPSTDTDGAVKVAEGVRSAISAIRIATVEQRITVSAGVATLPRDAGDSVTLFRAADRALYTAKRSGRDCVRAASDESAEVKPVPPEDE